MSTIKYGPPRRQLMTPNYLEQQRRAQESAFLAHQRMIAAGWTWDGMDGYTAPGLDTEILDARFDNKAPFPK